MIRIATRRSPLAMWQAERVAERLRGIRPDLAVVFVSLDTVADQRLDVPIADLGGKGAFSKEVQQLVLTGQADLAVHSAKDLQAQPIDGLVLAAFPERGDVRDCLVGARLDDLGSGAVVATGSNRRRVQLRQRRGDLTFSGLRGNIATRLSQLDRFDAIIMAVTALERLQLGGLVVDPFTPTDMIPQVGQGALAVECRDDDRATRELLAEIDDASVRATVTVERAFLAELGGDCLLPAGANAELDSDGQIRLRAMLASDDGGRLERVELTGGSDDNLGERAARWLRAAVTPA